MSVAGLSVQVSRVSLLYETAPMYVTEQPAFLNAAVLGRTDLPPLQLLYHCKQIEKQAGMAAAYLGGLLV
jgi:2-amino-4-hydroxy-6-hydroxymethyldihydropteridine diphosphokinase